MSKKDKKMKYVFILLSIAVFTACINVDEPRDSENASKVLTICDCNDPMKLGYDPKKDAYINGILDTKPVSIRKDKWSDTFTFTYEEIQIRVYHDEYIPYQQKEAWSFYCNYKDGRLLMLQSPLDVPLHQVSPKTLNRIKNMCSR
jgi:hypothetical protein